LVYVSADGPRDEDFHKHRDSDLQPNACGKLGAELGATVVTSLTARASWVAGITAIAARVATDHISDDGIAPSSPIVTSLYSP